MKIVCIYGSDELKAKSRYLDIVRGVKKKGWQVAPISNSFIEKIKAASIFDDTVLFTCETPLKLTVKDLEWIANASDDSDASLLLLFKETLPAKFKKVLPKNTKFEEFKVPQLLFTFIDSVYPGNAKKALQLLKSVNHNTPIELTFAMLARQIRDLYWILKSPKTLSLPDWKASKLSLKAEKFGEEKLVLLIESLAIADIAAKTSEVPLETSLDLIIIKGLTL